MIVTERSEERSECQTPSLSPPPFMRPSYAFPSLCYSGTLLSSSPLYCSRECQSIRSFDLLMDIIIALKTTTRFSRLTGQDRDIYSEKEKYSINFTSINFNQPMPWDKQNLIRFDKNSKAMHSKYITGPSLT